MAEVKRQHEPGNNLKTDSIRDAIDVSRRSAESIGRVAELKRALYFSLGLVCVGLAALGALLPLLPTTPFLILASSFFVKSSPAWEAWLLRTPVWGSMLRDWNTHHAVRPRTKRLAFLVIVLSIVVSMIASQFSWPLTMLLFGLAAIGLIVVWRLPVICIEAPMPRDLAAIKDHSLARFARQLSSANSLGRKGGRSSKTLPAGLR